jgi:hypothetical protein
MSLIEFLQPHDLSTVGWVAAFGYVLAAALCFRRMRDPDSALTGRFWSAAAMLMIALALNKQLDLQTLLTDTIRNQARHAGWYRERRTYQIVFVMVTAAFALVASGLIFWLFRHGGAAVRLTSCGLVLLSAFVAIRVGSFHHTDVMGRINFLGFRVHELIELMAIGLVSIGAALRLKLP